MLTSIDREGTGEGYDLELVDTIASSVTVPVIASGGMGCHEDLSKAVKDSSADAIAMADILHYDRSDVESIRNFCHANDINVREYEA